MAHRTILTERQRADLFDLPTDEATLLRHYILADDDIENILTRRRAHNRFGFALQLCALRFPGRLLAAGEIIPQEISRFIAAQLGLKPDDLMGQVLVSRRSLQLMRTHTVRDLPDLPDLRRRCPNGRFGDNFQKRSFLGGSWWC